jgi:hypothetical protein
MSTKLLLGSASNLRVLLNGKEVYKGQPGKDRASPDQATVDVELREGANQVLIEAIYKGDNQAVFARFVDPDRKLRYAEGKGK